MTENKTIGIIGVGMVGGALLDYFKKEGIEPYIYDKGKNFGSMEEVNKADIIFLCIPTPFDREKQSFDLSYVEEACANVSGNKTIVIKSTVVPGTTQKLQEKYPQHKFLFNPEFLVEKRANQDMLSPDRQIVGFTENSKDFAQEILNLLPSAPYEKIIRSQEAEMIKYFGNNFLAIKVIFSNQMHSLCKKLDIDYDLVRDGASADKRIGPSHLDINHGGYQGYGGKCLIKDIRALIQIANENGIDLKLHKTTEAINNELMRKQNIDDPEKFSIREL